MQQGKRTKAKRASWMNYRLYTVFFLSNTLFISIRLSSQLSLYLDLSPFHVTIGLQVRQPPRVHKLSINIYQHRPDSLWEHELNSSKKIFFNQFTPNGRSVGRSLSLSLSSFLFKLTINPLAI